MPGTSKAKKPVREIKAILEDHDLYVDSLVGEFERELTTMSSAAQAKVLGDLQAVLKTQGSSILATPANRRILRSIDKLISTAMYKAGYSTLASEYVQGWNGAMPYFNEVVDSISSNLKTPLKANFTKTDSDFFASQQLDTVDALGSFVDTVAAGVKRKALYSVGAMAFGDLVDAMSTTFQRGIGEAKTLAETSQVMFFRTITDRGFEKIEDQLPVGLAVKYKFEGPNDKLTRPFCKALLAKGEGLTRKEIAKLDNGQLPNPLLSGGGFNCRHQWILTPIDEAKKPRAKKAAKPKVDPTQTTQPAQVSKPSVRDSRTGEQVRAELAAFDVQAIRQAKFEEFRAETDAERRKKLKDEMRSLSSDETIAELIRGTLYADKPATVNARYFTGAATISQDEDVRRGVKAFERLIGAGLVDGKEVKIRFTPNSRAYYAPDGILISDNGTSRVMVHELGHWLEDLSPEVHEKAKQFLERRTTTNGVRDTIERMSDVTGHKAYGPLEVTRKDKFGSPYVGKAYELPNGTVMATEIISMGLEYMYEEPRSFARSDPDFFDFIWSIMRGRK